MKEKNHKSDIEIASESQMLPIREIAEKIGVLPEETENYGNYKGKIDYRILDRLADREDGHLVLVTAITPTPAGEGKTTVSVGLGDALSRLGKKALIALREPSQGPVFGMKGGAAGGGYAQVVPMEDINLHFTGDMHAITSANNLLAALLDNHIHHGNSLGIDSRSITWKRCLDVNDRQLRNMVNGLGGRVNGVPREDGFNITVASEIMAILCLASDLENLKERLKRIVVASDFEGRAVTAGDLKAHGAMAALLKDALKPNLVQTLENTPAFVHGGPFANIAHGCSSLMATRTGLKLADYVVTEAGFGADLGAEKFLDIKCRIGNLTPSAAVIVATVRALKHHGGASREELATEGLDYLEKGLPNLYRHVENMTEKFEVPVVVAVNRFPTDTEAEINLLLQKCEERGIQVALTEVWAKGGEGGEDLAEKLVAICENREGGRHNFIYSEDMAMEVKIEKVVKHIYGGDGVDFTSSAVRDLEKIRALGYEHLPICFAKTQYSFSDDPKKPAAPEGFRITVRNAVLSAGAGFVVILTGDIMTMPGLPKLPAAETIDVDREGKISGLF